MTLDIMRRNVDTTFFLFATLRFFVHTVVKNSCGALNTISGQNQLFFRSLVIFEPLVYRLVSTLIQLVCPRMAMTRYAGLRSFEYIHFMANLKTVYVGRLSFYVKKCYEENG